MRETFSLNFYVNAQYPGHYNGRFSDSGSPISTGLFFGSRFAWTFQSRVQTHNWIQLAFSSAARVMSTPKLSSTGNHWTAFWIHLQPKPNQPQYGEERDIFISSSSSSSSSVNPIPRIRIGRFHQAVGKYSLIIHRCSSKTVAARLSPSFR